jgi:hypothetical protein
MFYKELAFPVVPLELINLELNKKKELGIEILYDTGYGNVYTKNSKNIIPCKLIREPIESQDLRDWLSRNILQNKLNKMFIATQESRNNKPSTHIVHSDIKRKMALNYVIEPGGDNVITSWYQERGKDLYRSKNGSKNMQSDSGKVDYNNLEILESAVFQKNKWYALDVETLHDVDNITSIRKSISIGFMNKIYLE